MTTTTTCIVALKHNGKVTIGGDSAGVGGYAITPRADKKVFTKTDPNGVKFAFGFTSSFRMGQLLNHSLTLPALLPKVDLEGYMVTAFINACRTCFKTGGYQTTVSGADIGGTFLVGVNGRIFMIDGDYQVGESLEDYNAVGCGTDLALGSLFTSKGNPTKRVTTALEAAAKFSAGVCGPFNLVTV